MNDSSASEALAHNNETTVTTSRVVSCSPRGFWKALVSPEGTAALLGEGAVLGAKGESWRAADGTFGVIRTYHPNEQVRFSWHADADADTSLVDLRLIEIDEGTRLELQHGPVSSDAAEATESRWNGVLEHLGEMGCQG